MGFFKTFWKGEDSPTEHGIHIGSYHRFFEGYVERHVADERTGKAKIVRVYAAPWYVRTGTESMWKQAKARFAGLYALSAALLILSATALELPDPARYYQAFVAFAILSDFHLLYKGIKYLAAPRKMTAGEYKALWPSLYRGAFVSAVCAFAAAAARIVNAILSRIPAIPMALPGAVCLAFSGIAMLLLALREKRAVFERQDNENADEHGAMIQY